MLFDYFYWQFAAGPQWLITVSWNFQKALWQFFSIKVMLRTLIAHWHKDVMVFKGGLENLAMSVIWNQISRGIGFIIRSAVIITWLIAVGITVPLSALLVVVFIAWPLIVILALATGAALFIV